MAFTKESFFDLQTGNADDSLFSEWKRNEIDEMQRGIGGDLSNDGILIAQVNKSFVDSVPFAMNDIEFGFVTNAMRDTMLSGCHAGITNDKTFLGQVCCASLNAGLSAIVRLGLLLSKDIQS